MQTSWFHNRCYFWCTWPGSRESRLLSDSQWNSRDSRPFFAAIHFLEGWFAKTRLTRFFTKRESIRREDSRFACESRIDYHLYVLADTDVKKYDFWCESEIYTWISSANYTFVRGNQAENVARQRALKQQRVNSASIGRTKAVYRSQSWKIWYADFFVTVVFVFFGSFWNLVPAPVRPTATIRLDSSANSIVGFHPSKLWGTWWYLHGYAEQIPTEKQGAWKHCIDNGRSILVDRRHNNCSITPHGTLLNSTWNYNSHDTTTFECPKSTSRRPKVVTTVKWRLLHLAIDERQMAIFERQKLHSQRPPNYDNCEPTAVKWRLLQNRATTAKCNDREMTS